MLDFFMATFGQMATLFIVLAVSYILRKKDVLSENSDMVFSKLLARVVGPTLCFETFSSNFKSDNLKTNMSIIFCGTIVLIAVYLLARVLSPLFDKDSYMKNIYIYSFTIANIGYMGYPITQAVFGDKVMFDMMIFCIPANVFIYSAGYAMLNPLNKKITFKSLINPTFFGMALGALVGILNIPLPIPVSSAVSMFADSMGLLAMIVTGVVIAKYPFKEIVNNPKIYIASFLRLIAIPSVLMMLMLILNVPKIYVLPALCFSAMPLGLNTVVFPASFGADTKPGASMALISTLGSIVTIPLMFSIFGG